MGGTLGTVLFIVVMIGFMYFFMIRPQRKQQTQHQQMVNSLKKGDAVVTIGRLHGVVDSIDTENRTVTLDCDGIFLVFDLSAIAKVTPAAAPEATVTSDADTDTESATAAVESSAAPVESAAASADSAASDSEK